MLAIFGPTASGKSAVSGALLGRMRAEAVSADSMQVYKGLPILSNQPSVPTRLVSIWPLAHTSSVGEYAPLAHAAIDEILAGGSTPVVSGGTGLYLRAALADLGVPPSPPPAARARFEALYAELGPERAHALLAERDPAVAEAVHPNDRRRVVRALELHEVGSSLRPEDDRLWTESTRHPTTVFTLDVDPKTLAARIERRTNEMFERGVEQEVKAALRGEISSTARQMIGLREVTELPRPAASEAIVRRTLRYASYQRKWLRRIPGAVSLAADRDPEDIADQILEVARSR